MITLLKSNNSKHEELLTSIKAISLNETGQVGLSTRNIYLERKVVIINNMECIFLKIDDICYLEANGAYTNIFLNNGSKLIVSKNIKIASRKFPENQFYRIHKSYIVNMNYISKYIKSDGGYVILENGTTIPVSIRKKEVLVHLINLLSV